ncbi:MAG: hypothetical protein F8N36_14115 [Desulfovibrio sp.]|uniref:hypothetical protein n=1 Tax=Desulfovibrio sp. TaxID=885 RepID=UPI00135E498F|nr:hypothetical protein [Desulfovibrio sp.]MTJ93974.1 hypothetical protein [Desulfovibrio sp.]
MTDSHDAAPASRRPLPVAVRLPLAVGLLGVLAILVHFHIGFRLLDGLQGTTLVYGFLAYGAVFLLWPRRLTARVVPPALFGRVRTAALTTLCTGLWLWVLVFKGSTFPAQANLWFGWAVAIVLVVATIIQGRGLVRDLPRARRGDTLPTEVTPPGWLVLLAAVLTPAAAKVGKLVRPLAFPLALIAVVVLPGIRFLEPGATIGTDDRCFLIERDGAYLTGVAFKRFPHPLFLHALPAEDHTSPFYAPPVHECPPAIAVPVPVDEPLPPTTPTSQVPRA